MTDYQPDIASFGVLNARKVIRALEKEQPFRFVNNVWSAAGVPGSDEISSHVWTALQYLTFDLNPDDVAVLFFDVNLFGGGTGDFDFRLVYGEEDTVLPISQEIANYSLERTYFSGRAYIRDTIGSVSVQLQARIFDTGGLGSKRIITQSAQMKALIFKAKSQPESFPIEGVTPVLWLEGDDLFTADGSFQASNWNDKSASAIEAAQATSGNRPLITSKSNSENLFLYSEDFSNAYWTKSSGSISSNALANPVNGETTADLFTENSANTVHYIDAVTVDRFNTGISYHIDIYAKQNGRNYLEIRGYGSAFSAEPYARFDLANGATVSSGNGGAASISDAGDGWYRCRLTATAGATGTGEIVFYLGSASGTYSYLGNGTSGVYFFGAACRRASTDSAYLSTTYTALEQGIGGHRAMSFRQSDKMTLTGNPAALKISGDITFFFVLEKRTSTGAGSDETIINCLTGSATGYLIYYDNNDGQLHYSTANGSVATADSTTGLLALDTPTVVTIQKIGTTATFYKNGVAWGSGTVSNPSNQTYFDICQSNRHLLLGAAIIVGGTMAASTRQAIEAMLIKDYLRDPEISSLKLSAEWLQDYISSFAGKVFEEVWTGSSTLSSTGNVIDSIEVQLEDDEIALIFADLGYRTSSTSTGNCDIYINIDGSLYGEKHGLEYGYYGAESLPREYRASLMAKKTDGNGGLVTIELKHDAVSGNNVTVTESQLLVLVLKKRV